MTTSFAGRRVYLDTNVFIYAVEAFPKYARSCTELLAAAERGHLQAVTSELALAEALVVPHRKGLHEMVALYSKLIHPRPTLNVMPVSRSILVRSAELRAALGGKLPDGIHAATADITGCDFLVTGDAALRVGSGVEIVTLESMLIESRL